LSFFAGNEDQPSIRVLTSVDLDLEIQQWDAEAYRWEQSSDGDSPLAYSITVEKPNGTYSILASGQEQIVISDDKGQINFKLPSGGKNLPIQVKPQK